MLLQPCDWYEHDDRGKYVVDVFGRTDTQKVVCLRITGFKPYFYVDGQPDLNVAYEAANRKNGAGQYWYKVSKRVPEYSAPTLSKVEKYDVFAGFSEFKKKTVYKVTCDSLAIFRGAKTGWKYIQQYESNLPPFLRLFHDRHLGPASPLKVDKVSVLDIPLDENEVPQYSVDEFYTCDFKSVSAAEASIPMLVGCYDLEMYSASGLFPQHEKDPIIQIGISYRWSHKMLDPALRIVYVLGDVAPSDEEGVEFVSCATEQELLTTFMDEVKENNPDILCGYNIFGFDDAYLEGRAQKLGIDFDLSRKKAGWGEKNFETKKFELASGKYDLRFMTLRGRLGLDLLLNMRREHSLDSFKLDNVAGVFLKDKVVKYENGRISTKSTRGLRTGNYVTFVVVGNTADPYREGEKYAVTSVDAKGFTIATGSDLFNDLSESERKNLEWTFAKDDVDAQELFHLHAHGGPEGRARIAKYCIQDCDLVLTLMAKLDTIVNARGMADVCKVPMEYVLRRGQGIKIFSAVLYYASQRDQILRVQESLDGDTGYEGAIVISPKIGMYLDQPISVLDFNSLYPTNMIAYNISPDTLVSVRVFDSDGNRLDSQCEGYKKDAFAKLEEAGYVLDEIEYDNKQDDKIVGKTICTYAQRKDNDEISIGVLPKTLEILLKKRKEFKEKMEDVEQYDEAQRSVFNGLQLAYKVVANSVYGQTGSRTSPIRKLCVAASTTAAGRKALGIARRVVETEFGAEVVYGDTDSIFVRFPTKDLAESIRLGIDAGKRITSQCRRPYKIAYEKTFYPFILFCRKRYVGMMYEEDPTIKPKRKSMGIVLKRRDNAPIVKDVFGGALDILMQDRDVKAAQKFVNQKLLDILENRIPLEKYIVTKSLRDDYKNPEQIAHRVLADRMAKRDPGTAPKVGDRIAFVYVAENSKAAKQGDRIEEVGYVRKNGLTPDAKFYITNQVKSPVAQLFALCIDQLDGYVAPKRPSYETLMKEMLQKYGNEEEATLSVLEKKERQLDSIMFMSSESIMRAMGIPIQKKISSYFSKQTI
jgi:DNA polymerase elongation subunit (family B)